MWREGARSWTCGPASSGAHCTFLPRSSASLQEGQAIGLFTLVHSPITRLTSSKLHSLSPC